MSKEIETQESEVYEINAAELKELAEDKSKDNTFANFEIGKPYVVEVTSSKVGHRTVEFEEGKPMSRFDINVEYGEGAKVWSIGKKNLRIIIDNWDSTKKFNVMRAEKSYSIIPLL